MQARTSWKVHALGDLADYLNGYAFEPSDWVKSGTPIIRIQNLTDPAKPFNYYDGDIPDRYRVNTGDLLVSWSATLGSFIWNRGPAVLNQHIFKVIPNERVVDKEFLHFLVLNTLDEMARHAHGLAMKHITKKKFEALEVRIPTLREQCRIVTRIKECTERADEIERLRESSKRECAAIKAAARYDALKTNGAVVRLDALISDGPTNGLYKHSKYYGGGTPILRIDNFDGGDVLDGSATLKRLQLTKDEQVRFALRPGDIVLNRVNGSLDVVGKACLIHALAEATVFESNMMRLRIDDARANGRYVLHFLASPQCRDQIKAKAHIIQQASINQADVGSFEIPLPHVAEQGRISERLDQICAIADDLSAEVAQAAAPTSALREAILRKAFAGEL